ncbi:hypothetical protein GCM10027046_19510 [Uliginosibacterium flavum]|uniref:FkbM family methyltransferase n=1 Tax=Uliginosibacterium flavum TaxID=1396831 RepID=A0ABV2TIB6_9RHOO
MSFPPRPIAFVLTSSNHGSMIVNRNDYCPVNADTAFGVGHEILNQSSYAQNEIQLALELLTHRRNFFGPSVFAIDGGANIGVHTVEWARHMFGWGEVYAFEAQEAIFYALAGNLALNNCLNAHARLCALGESNGSIEIPCPDYFQPASFGSLELRKATTEFIGQKISYEKAKCATVPMAHIDTFEFPRIDFIKIDVEGMELDVLLGGKKSIARHKPIMMVEVIKSDRAELIAFMAELDYQVFNLGMNMLAIHESDPTLRKVSENNGTFSISI